MTAADPRTLLVVRPERVGRVELSVVIPAYNEAFRLPAALDGLRGHVDHATTEIIVVDDGSTDGTAEVARRNAEWAKHLVVIESDQNLGKGGAVRCGVAVARGDAIGFIDADNATDLSALGPMTAALGGSVAASFGSRHAAGASVTGAPLLRGVMGRAFNHVVKWAAGSSIGDTQCGAKVFQGPAARLAFGTSSIDGFAFDVEILRTLLMLGFDVVEHPVDWTYVHGTKIRPLTPVRMLADIGRLRLRPPEFAVTHVDTTWMSWLDDVADPLRSGPLPETGAPVRLLFPFNSADPTAAAVRDRLEQSGVESRPGQSRTWLQLSGTSPS